MDSILHRIRAVLPAEDCDYFGAPETAELYSEMLYVGFWTDKGNADNATLELLSKLRGKKVFLFAEQSPIICR